jgi:transposase
MFREELSQQLFQLLVIKRLVAHDHFHINAVMNKALDDLRKSQHSKNVLKGQRFLLLRNYDDLSPEQCNRLNKLFEINKELFMAHSLKEQFRIFWQKKSIGEAEDFLNKWCIDVLISGSNYV